MKAFWFICFKCYKERLREADLSSSPTESHWAWFFSLPLRTTQWVLVGFIFPECARGGGGVQQPQADNIPTPCVKSSLLQEIPDQHWTNFAYPSWNQSVWLEDMHWLARQGSHAYPDEPCLVHMDSEWEWSGLPWIKAHCGQKENEMLDRWQVPPSTASAWSESHTKILFCVWLEHLCSQQQAVSLRKRDLTGFKGVYGKKKTQKEKRNGRETSQDRDSIKNHSKKKKKALGLSESGRHQDVSGTACDKQDWRRKRIQSGVGDFWGRQREETRSWVLLLQNDSTENHRRPACLLLEKRASRISHLNF